MIANLALEITTSQKVSQYLIKRYGQANARAFIGVLSGLNFVSGNFSGTVTVAKSSKIAENLADISKQLPASDAKTFISVVDDIAANTDKLIKNGDFTAEQIEALKKSAKFVQDDLSKGGNRLEKVSVVLDGSDWFNNVPAGLKVDLGGTESDLYKFFAGSSNRSELVDSWKVLRTTDVGLLETFSILYKNNGFKKYFDELAANPASRKFSNVLKIEEEAVLKYYTTNPGYKDLNKALRGGEGVNLTDEFIAQEKLMNKALDKLPNSAYNSPDKLLYRIENLTEEQIATLYKKGENFTSKGFYSSTYSEGAIIDAMRNRSHTVLIRIKGKNGKLIEDLSTLPKEKEILFKSETGFKVENVGYSPNPDDYMTPIRTIWLTEL